jgi:hypothetical protein
MDSQRTQYKWEIVAWSALRLTKESEKKTWVLQESHWFDRKADCIKDFQTVIKHGYDLADSWGSEVYLLKRKVMIKKYFPY